MSSEAIKKVRFSIWPCQELNRDFRIPGPTVQIVHRFLRSSTYTYLQNNAFTIV